MRVVLYWGNLYWRRCLAVVVSHLPRHGGLVHIRGNRSWLRCLARLISKLDDLRCRAIRPDQIESARKQLDVLVKPNRLDSVGPAKVVVQIVLEIDNADSGRACG